MKGRQDVAVAIIGTALGLGALIGIPIEIRGQSYAAIADVQSPAFFPILIALLLVALSLMLLASTRRDPAKHAAKAPQESMRSDEIGPIEAPGRLAATALCLVAYYGALDLIGMVAASVVLIAVLALVLGYRRYGVLGAISLALPIAIFLAFQKGLFVMLPAGRIF